MAKHIHLRMDDALQQELDVYMKKHQMKNYAGAIRQLVSQALFNEVPITMIHEDQLPVEDSRVESLLKQIEIYKEQIATKDKQIMGLVAAQGQMATNMKLISDKLEAPKKNFLQRFFDL